MTIADLIKYVDFLKKREGVLRQKMNEISSVRTIQKVIANSPASQVVEEQTPAMSV
jgi:hypothetical protein